MILLEEPNEPSVLNPLRSSQLDIPNYNFVYMARASLKCRGKADMWRKGGVPGAQTQRVA